MVHIYVIHLEILDLEHQYKYLVNNNSPSQKVGYKPSERFKKIDHQVPMLSLSNAFSREDIEDFIKKIQNFLNKKKNEEIVNILKGMGVKPAVRMMKNP